MSELLQAIIAAPPLGDIPGGTPDGRSANRCGHHVHIPLHLLLLVLDHRLADISNTGRGGGGRQGKRRWRRSRKILTSVLLRSHEPEKSIDIIVKKNIKYIPKLPMAWVSEMLT